MDRSTRHAVRGALDAAAHFEDLTELTDKSPGLAENLREAARTVSLRIESSVRMFGTFEILACLIKQAQALGHEGCVGCEHEECGIMQDATDLFFISNEFGALVEKVGGIK